ncbi:DUF805 domain-containing protein [Chitinibacter fontanus]|uniref:DUF805 domain-containing protein n=1 Tax=Chitinibacter fontanus TaxID=1737446 RepID=A0A7D5V9P2_9NEIS|nr:DUF805 domain-containing protein [Chitinibacter fontanus]QLI81518.1 DUF805 domain-containing protein [Chitinibacter fontanus]
MSFLTAIKRCLQQYAVFNGRASRAEFWWWMLFQTLCYLAITLSLGQGMGSSLLLLTLLLPSLAVGIRRLHDIGRSGKWVLIGLIPVVGWCAMLYWHTRPSDTDNQFGPVPLFV